jgi:hypothetical protein
MSRTLIFLVVYMFQCSFLLAAPPHTRAMSIDFDAPTIRMYVSDSSNLRTGVDPNKSLDGVGQQLTNEIPYSISEIPNSGAEQSYFDDSETSTGWELDFGDPQGDYILNYSSSLPSGASIVAINLTQYSPRTLTQNNISLLARKGIYKQIRISVNSANAITITPIINSGDFLKDTQAACSLGAISPPEACEALEALAAVVEKAKSKDDSRLEAETLELYLSILNRLHNWGQKGYRQDWDDFKDHSECDHLRQKDLHETKFFAKDPAYSALKLDAETLLKGLPKVGGRDKDGHRDGDDRVDDHHDVNDKK